MQNQPSVDELAAWIALKNVPGIGDRVCARLIKRFDRPEAVFSAAIPDLLSVEGMNRKKAAAIRNFNGFSAARNEVVKAWESGFSLVTLRHPDYPWLLSHIPDPPPIIYVSGKISPSVPAVAVVGTRNPTRYGLDVAYRLAYDLASMGFVIVSGLANGIDTQAHRGALDAGGRTVAVLGSGLCRIYPWRNTQLARRISQSGAVVSEFNLNASPEAHHFPRRNRIISGMSIATVVVEASQKSGSLITARLAAEQGREVFAVPGRAGSPKSVGTHQLLRQGACLAESASDIMEELKYQLAQMTPRQKDSGENQNSSHVNANEHSCLTGDALRVYHALDFYPEHIDDLCRRLGMDPARLAAILVELEIEGLVAQEPGKRFYKTGE